MQTQFTQWYESVSGVRNLHFIHVGKTGGSAIKSALEPHTRHNNYRLLLHEHRTILTDIPVVEQFFFCVRNPIDRFVSGFYSRQRQGRPRYHYPWSASEEQAFHRYQTPNQLAEALGGDAEEKKYAQAAMRAIQHVNSFYWDWFIDESYLTSRKNDLLLVCHQQSLNSDFQQLKALINLPESLQLPGKGSAKAHKTPSTKDKSLSAEARKNLEAWYKPDFEFLSFINQLKQFVQP